MTNTNGMPFANRERERLVIPERQSLAAFRPSASVHQNYPTETLTTSRNLVVKPLTQAKANGRSSTGARAGAANNQSAKAAKAPEFLPTKPVYYEEAVPAKKAQQVKADQQAILRQAAAVRAKAKAEAEAKVRAELAAKQQREQLLAAQKQQELAKQKAELLHRQQMEAARLKAQQLIAQRRRQLAAQQAQQQQMLQNAQAQGRTRQQEIQQNQLLAKQLEIARQSQQAQPNFVAQLGQMVQAQSAQSGAATNPAANPFSPLSPAQPQPSLSPMAAKASPVRSAALASAFSNLNNNSANSGANDNSANQPANFGNLAGATSGGAIAIQPNSMLEKLANAKVNISFKMNKQRIFSVLRYIAIVVIIATSAYLAWDTYTTNQSVQKEFSGNNAASAMSIAGANPATADRTAVSQQQKAAYTVPADQPRFINIPVLGVNARVMSVGVNSKGNIDTPTNLNDTAWYDGSAKPGMDGQVFIDGHTSFSNSINAAFNDLPKLKAGDQISIEKGNGEKINYTVTEVETKNTNDVDMGKALNPPAGAKKGLTLMTCTGTFNYRTQTADKRLIVYAVQE